MSLIEKTYSISEELQALVEERLKETYFTPEVVIRLLFTRIAEAEDLSFLREVLLFKSEERKELEEKLSEQLKKIPVKKIDWDDKEQVKELLDDW